MVFTRGEFITALAASFASASVRAPATLHSINLLAPSPSAATILAKSRFTLYRALTKLSKAGPSLSISLLPAIPLAIIIAISFVEVSPSTDTMLKVFSVTLDKAFCKRSVLIAQSVVRKTRRVAILGSIIPEPLAIPPILHSIPSISKETATSLGLVSVVIIASAALSE